MGWNEGQEEGMTWETEFKVVSTCETVSGYNQEYFVNEIWFSERLASEVT